MATNEKRRDKSGDLQDVTTWFKVTLWGNQAETASKYLSKGRPVYIEGRLRIEEWTDRDNNNRFTLDVQATDMQFISAGRDEAGDYSGGHDNHETHSGPPMESGASASAGSGAGSSVPAPTPAADDDIPF
jgi:single-strand DNA-binding protein